MLPVAEHILLESDLREVPVRGSARKVHAGVAFRSRLRRRSLQLEIIDYYYLCVRCCSRSTRLEYVLDLRFVGTPQLTRHISWRWITAAMLLAMLLAYGIATPDVPTLPRWQRHWFEVYGAIVGAWVVVTLVAAWRTTTTVRLISTDGAATLLEYTSGLGTLRGVRRFMAKVAAHIRLAAAARRGTRAAHLRDAMREHARLRELGALSGPQYESAKTHILGQHSPAKAPSFARAAARFSAARSGSRTTSR